MKLHQRLMVGDQTYPLIDHDVRLSLLTPGRAAFTVQARQRLSGLVRLAIGYQAQALEPYFFGYVDTCTAIDAQQQHLFCRELGATLNRRLPLALRNVRLPATLQAIAAASGLHFLTPEHGDRQHTAAMLYNTGNGYALMHSLAAVYRIPQFLWQQQTNGEVFVGSWQHSRWATRPLDIAHNWQQHIGPGGTATLPVVPSLRPGIYLAPRYLTHLHYQGSQMHLTLDANPWRI